MTPHRTGAAALDRDAAQPLWAQLRGDLVARVERGEFPDRFPGEMELVEQYAVSRHTVREALRRLRNDGVIESSRGRSSVAHPGQISQELGAIYSLFHALESRGIEQQSELLAADLRQDRTAASRLGVPPDTELVHLERIRRADGEPMAHDRAWLRPDRARRMLGADLSHGALYDEWQRLEGVRLTGGRETIRAVLPTPRMRALLGMRRGEAAMEIERVGCLDDEALEFRTTLVRGSRFSFTAVWETGRSYQVDVDA